MPEDLRAAAPLSGAVATHCPYCSLQCGISLDASAGPVVLDAQPDFPTNLGGLCAKGWTAAELLEHPDRLTAPLVRDAPHEPLRSTSWDDALDRVAAGIRTAQSRYGANGVGLFGGGGLTNEKAYQFGKFARATLRTAMIDYNGRFCMSSAANAATRAFGIDRGLPFPLADIAETDAILLAGSNPADTLPPAMQFFETAHRRGAPLVVIDPRVTRTAATADLHLQPVPGTDLALANGMLNVAVREKLIDRRYISERTDGFDAVQRAVRLYWPDRVERISGVPEADIVRAARLLAGARHAMILTARGAEQHRSGSDTALAFINLALALDCPAARTPATAPSPARETGRAAASTARKLTNFPATVASTIRLPAPTLPASGASTPRNCPPPACRPTRCSTVSEHPKAFMHCGSSPPTSWSRPHEPVTWSTACDHWTCSSCRTCSCPRPRRWPTSCCPAPSGPRRPGR
jgi:assimilatory nitrate reductase catalytic subunit